MSYTTISLLFLALLAVMTPAAILVLSAIAGPRRRVADKTPYECGAKPFTSARRRFSIKFYLVAMLFIIFDIETIFLFPWAVHLNETAGTPEGIFTFFVMLAFLLILAIGFIYEWGRGALEWDR
jgi:NADH-quinone oxidoreductase subunit A